MVTAPASSLPPWLRWLLFALIMGGMVSAYVKLARQSIYEGTKIPLTALEVRHLALTRETWKDLQLDFSESFSEPLKKLAPHRTDGLAQPLWPWVAAWMLHEDDLSASLQVTAWFRVGLTLSCILVLGMVCMRHFALPAALMSVTLVGFHGLLGTISVFTGATLFHLFFLLTWLACLYALQRNSLWVYGLVGGFAALAYLAEDRILPLLAIFILISTLRALWGWLAAQWHRGKEGTTLWVRRNHVFGLLLLAASFSFIAGPRLSEAYLQFGNATFQYADQVRWLDSSLEAESWIQNHPDKTSLDQVPTLEKLTAQSYFQSHTREAIQTRLLNGMRTTLLALKGHGGEVLAVMLVLLIVLTLVGWCATPAACHPGERLHPETTTTVLFLVLATLAYLVTASWDSAVIRVDHLQALTGPVGLSLLWGYTSVLRRARKRGANWFLSRGYQAVLWLMLGMTWFQFWKSAAAML